MMMASVLMIKVAFTCNLFADLRTQPAVGFFCVEEHQLNSPHARFRRL